LLETSETLGKFSKELTILASALEAELLLLADADADARGAREGAARGADQDEEEDEADELAGLPRAMSALC
jgi:hypothetical protein